MGRTFARLAGWCCEMGTRSSCMSASMSVCSSESGRCVAIGRALPPLLDALLAICSREAIALRTVLRLRSNTTCR